ncbi:malto-oligosyltrehalose trehalohydrolase [Methyloligella solikamskensis]|uniref:Malto-oligosyltrehalose trehalohydrolase n=1 Tax=Methyloligella solikamskensis TaxID=1177756 RepID=A0ABW3J8Z8_9HYPH
MTDRFEHDIPWGAQITEHGARFRLWAPSQEEITLIATQSGEAMQMIPQEEGWFELETSMVKPGEGYHFALHDGMRVPDPAARAQMDDVHGPSKLVDPKAYQWKTADWKGRPWPEAVLYELHTGTFSADGTFDGVLKELDRLAEIGVTAVELCPVAQFAGNRGWGYDGVLLYAPHVAYGGPERLKALVDAAHERDLMILLDVVYNHFGPDGNYLGLYASEFFHPERHTPWGPAIAFDRKPVRDFFVHNVLYWLEEYRFDGLRFDAIDQIDDPSDEPILKEMARTVRKRFPDRHIHLTSEDDSNLVTLLEFDEENRPKLFTGEWNDDWHHAMHHILTGEDDGFYEDYVDDPGARVARMEAEGFDYQGEPSSYRGGAPRGEASGHIPPTAFVNFLQNHDQTGNRPFGERLTMLASPEALETSLALLLLSPHTPLLYMGEEYGETRPFQYFTDFHGELADAVREGRREEFKKVRLFADPEARHRIPDPNALSTFEASQLRREEVPAAQREARETLVGDLLRIRRECIVPALSSIPAHSGRIEAQSGRAFTVRWQLGGGRILTISANLADEAEEIEGSAEGDVIYQRPGTAAEALEAGNLPPWSIVCCLK